ncbi:mitochondrial ribosomal death-associated protein 3-domain-containing protein [Echria macrotheca]|uniref:Small ribosomal subunit protein mS29 n=1 Tax=Echria macrotheca TaxID=438768 RepID=A0AAJ0F5T1_9PEZI|nr:mitochondrial ribosomal death-associated protein 3-domain-containing protein [Echria macrotheca]
MSAPNSLRCLARPSAIIPRSLTSAPWIAAPFSTSAPSLAKAETRKGVMPGGHVRSGKKMQLGKFKKNAVRQGKSPLPGERKAYRKRIQLSNSNALPVPGLEDVRPADMVDENKIGRVMSIPGLVLDQLRDVEAFKPTQYWGMFRTPSTLLRAETVDLARRMQNAADKKDMLRLVISGERLTGKSLLLLQSLTYAFMNDWVVIHIPEAQELTTACTEYAPIPETDPMQYMQNNYCLRLLQGIRKANERVLSRLTCAHSHTDLPQNIPVNSTLLQLTNSAKEPEGAWLVFQALWKELMSQTATRPPVLLALDGLAHIMRVSDYMSPSFEPVHSQDLALVRLFCDALSGKSTLRNGGAIIGATSRGNTPRSPSMELSLTQRLAEQAGEEAPKHPPYAKGFDPRSEEALKSVRVVDLKGISKPEARGLMEYWAASGVFRAACDEKTVTRSWTLGGHGVVGEMERASLQTLRP